MGGEAGASAVGVTDARGQPFLGPVPPVLVLSYVARVLFGSIYVFFFLIISAFYWILRRFSVAGGGILEFFCLLFCIGIRG